MAANLSPEYRTAEAAYRSAREPRARLELLREMLRVIPKHKGTERLQADIKARIKDLSGELGSARKGGGHGGPALVIRPEGAAQVALLGPPNAGKSLLHARLTGSGAHAAAYPFTTQHPEPGMMPHADVHFQLIDLPAVASAHPVPWLASTLQMADAALLVVDPGEPSCVEQLQDLHAVLRERRVSLTGRWDEPVGVPRPDGAGDEDPFALRLPTLLLVNKVERIVDLAAELDALRELTAVAYPMLAVSAMTGRGLAAIGPWLFDHLGIVRIYTKTPGRPPGPRTHGALRANLRARRVRRPAGGPGPRARRRRHRRVARLTARAGPEPLGRHGRWRGSSERRMARSVASAR
jgi:ribosome-interacting GTPase 1